MFQVSRIAGRAKWPVVACLLTLATVTAADRFWETRPADAWSAEEITAFASNSPWAKPTNAMYRVASTSREQAADPRPSQGRGLPSAGPCGLGSCGSVLPGVVTVIWESAQPVREALHPQIPPEFNGHYVVSIRGLEGKWTEDQLLPGATLAVKAQAPVQADLVQSRGASWVFGFRRELMPLSVSDREVTFQVRTGANFSNTLLKTTFNLREMVYRGAPAI